MFVLVRPFHALICSTVHPCLSAILPSTSPCFTVYVVVFAGAENSVAVVAVVCVLLSLDVDDDGLPPL